MSSLQEDVIQEVDEQQLMIVRYDATTRMFAIIMRLFTIGFAVLLCLTEDLFLCCIGLLFSIFLIAGMVDILLFRQFEIYRGHIVKSWYLFGSLCINLSKLKVARANSLFEGGRIYFWESGKQFKMFLMQLDILSMSKDDLKQLKRIFVNQRIIGSYDRGWHK